MVYTYFLVGISLFFGACTPSDTASERYIFFLHNRFLEVHELHEEHPDYGRAEYNEIIRVFEEEGFIVLSEKRKGNVDPRSYALGVVSQIDSLMGTGVVPENITVLGTSKGAYIAQYVSTLANNPDLNFVFVAGFRTSDMLAFPEINYCGRVLTIYEKSDPFFVSALARKEASNCELRYFKEIELNTGLGHGFLFKPLDEWVAPSIKWASGDYRP